MRRMWRGDESDYPYRNLPSFFSFIPGVMALAITLPLRSRGRRREVQDPMPAPAVVRVQLVVRAAALLLDEDGVPHAQGVGEERRVGGRVGVRGRRVGQFDGGAGRGVLVQVEVWREGGHYCSVGLIFAVVGCVCI